MEKYAAVVFKTAALGPIQLLTRMEDWYEEVEDNK